MSRILSYGEAINEAIYQSMEDDNKIIVMGQGVNDPNTVLGTTKGLEQKFPGRCIDTPIAEDGMTGVAIGTALAGFKVIHTHIRMDFVLLCMNQIINMAAKMEYMYGGEVNVPIVIKSMIGKSWGQGPQHSQGLYSLFINIPGLRVVAPTTPYDAKGAMIAAIAHKGPVLFIEHRHLHYQKGFVPEKRYGIVPELRKLKEGSDVTLIGVSQMVVECFRAAKILEENGIKAEVIDPIYLSPLDYTNIYKSVKKTKKVIVVDCDWFASSVGADIISSLHESGLDFRSFKMGFAHTTCPTAPSLEKEFYPTAEKIAKEAFFMFEENLDKFKNVDIIREEIEYKGPF